MVVEVEPRHPPLLEVYDLPSRSGQYTANARPIYGDDGQYPANIRIHGRCTVNTRSRYNPEAVAAVVRPHRLLLSNHAIPVCSKHTTFQANMRSMYGQCTVHIRIHGEYTVETRSIHGHSCPLVSNHAMPVIPRDTVNVRMHGRYVVEIHLIYDCTVHVRPIYGRQVQQ